MKRLAKKLSLFKIIANTFLYASAVVLIFPIYWMFIGSLMPDSLVTAIPPSLFPKTFYTGNYVELFTSAPTVTWLINSVFVSGMTALLICLVSAMAGYSFAKKRFIGSKLIFLIMILTMMIPRQILLVPLFRISNAMGLADSLAGLIIPSLGFPMGVFLMRQFMVTLPSDIFEAARIDGSSEIGLFVRMAVPLAKPGIAALMIFTFIRSWNDYLWQLIMISSTRLKTLPLGVAGFKEEYSARHGLLLAGAVLASLPMIIIFLSFQKYFTKGLTAGAVKG